MAASWIGSDRCAWGKADLLLRVAILLLLAACSPSRTDYAQPMPVTPAQTPPQWADQLTADEMAQVEALKAKPPAKPTAAQRELLAKADRVAQQAAARRADAQAWADRQRANSDIRAGCVAQAQMAVVMTPGVVNAAMAGLGAGSVCVDYYRRIGALTD